jgi:hypothetical protein
MDSFMGPLCASFDGPVAKYLLVMQDVSPSLSIHEMARVASNL